MSFAALSILLAATGGTAVEAVTLSAPVGEQSNPPVAEMIRLEAEIAGEMKPDDVPLGQWVDLDGMKTDDADLLQVVVAIPEGRSTRKWYYEGQALKDIHGEIMSTGLPGFLGHQREEAVAHEFPIPSTHWIGAKIAEDAAGKTILYVRGLIDKSQENLKRWIRRKLIRQVSIYGRPALRVVSGETRVVGYKPLSIDWTPLNRNGMPTRIVAMGEFDSTLGRSTGEQNEEEKPMTLAELLAALKGELAAKNTTPARILGELGISFDVIAGEMGGDAHAAVTAHAGAYGEIAAALGGPVDKPAEVVALAKAAKAAVDQVNAAQRNELVTKIVGEQITVEPVRPVVVELVNARLPQGGTEDEIKKVVGEIAALDHIKALIGGAFRSAAPPRTAAQAPNANQGQQGADNSGFVAGLRPVARSLFT